MTLLESLVALVILGLASAGFLQLFQGSSRSTRDAEAWVKAVGYAEASMEQTKLGTRGGERSLVDSLPPGFALDTDVQPWLGARGLEQITVTVALPDGGAFVLRRLVRVPPP